jgi:DNA-binding response OmpR family regulator
MYKAVIITTETEKAKELSDKLGSAGYACLIANEAETAAGYIDMQNLDLALVDMNGTSSDGWCESVWENLQPVKTTTKIPVIIIISKDRLDSIGDMPEADDFILEPFDIAELTARINKIIERKKTINGKDVIRHGDLIIDLAKCEVHIGNRPVNLTFMEFELLKFLLANRGRVFSRSKLLDEVWGYDYYGGDRTVDVHIRRLRSKIEDATHTYISTVRNIGYRFKE